jgi:xylose isomerase
MIASRYSSFDSGVGKEIEKGTATFASLDKFIATAGEPAPASGKQELYEMIWNSYVMPK